MRKQKGSGGRRDAHHRLLLGTPGAGTARLARRLIPILPAMPLAEALETTRIPRAAGRTGARTVFVTAYRLLCTLTHGAQDRTPPPRGLMRGRLPSLIATGSAANLVWIDMPVLPPRCLMPQPFSALVRGARVMST
jgi:hypothetical protein